jgi:HlyD family secretion protein
MQSSMSNAPAPQPGGGTSGPAAGSSPRLVAPAPHPSRRLRLAAGFAAASVVAVTGFVYYLNTRMGPEASGTAAGTSIRTASVSTGDLHATIRVSGVIAAEHFAALLAPQIRGSRNDRGRGSASVSSTTPAVTVSDSSTQSTSSSTTSSSLGAQRGTTNRFNDSATVNAKSTAATTAASSSSTAASTDSSSGSASTTPARGGGGRGGDFSLVLLSVAKGGVRVTKGEVVAEFDSQFQALRRDDYNDTVVQLSAGIKKMRSDLAVAKAIHEQQVCAAKAALDKALLDAKTVEVRSAIEAESFKLAVEEAQASYAQIVAEIRLLEESQRAQIRAAEIDRDQARMELERANLNVQKMTVKAPIDGIVVLQTIFRGGDFGQVQAGDQIYSGQPFLSIVDPASMVLNGTVNQVDAEKLRLGATARVRLDAYPDIQMPGTTVSIGALARVGTFRANYVGAIPVRLKLDRAEPRVIPDLSASAEIVLYTEKEATITPRAAIFQDGGNPFVFLRSAAGWMRRDVELGPGNHIAVAVRSGLRKGDIVALQRPL